ncbi:MAG TPA: discoidin domain-containing protein, partial [Cellulomonas sp.]|nr:discoidin domain-containing protein [Cellulomonas sp.]
MNLSHPRAGTRRVRASFAVVAALAVAAAGTLVPTGASAADTPPSDLARLGTVRASASQDDGDGAFPAELAVDGNDATRWASGNGPDSETAEFTAWLESDLGGPATIDGVTLRWETSYAVDYDVSVALDDPDDAGSWTTVYSQHAGDGGVDDITFDAPARARYVRVDMNKRAAATWQAPILHWYGYSLYTLQVLGTLDTPTVGLASTAVTGSAGTDVSVPVTLSNAADHEVSVRARTADGTARAGTDYEAVDRVVTFAPGETTATVTVPTTSHGALNGTRTFTVGLSEPSSGLELRTPSEVTVTLAPTGDLPDVGRTSVLEGFESGVPTTYVPWAQNTAPGLSTAVDATRPG